MSFYLRKSIRVGPLRFNLSKSGIGVSTGIKGFRVGKGPRGNYVHMGRGGLYYRKTFSSVNEKSSPNQSGFPKEPVDQFYDNATHEPLKEIESGDVQMMVDSSSAELVGEINNKRKKVRIWPIAAIFVMILIFILSKNSFPAWFISIVAIIGLLITITTYTYDQLRKTTVMFFELAPEIEKLYQSLHEAFDNIATCSSKWHVEAEGAIKDKKRNAGASNIIKRSSICLAKDNPSYVKTNISVPIIPVGKQKLYFFPDKILVFEPNAVGAVSYSTLKVDVESKRFIEDGSVPQDARIVDRTWKYVNKRGGPDKRFKDNKELPVVLYEDLHFRSTTGLNERIEISKVGIGDAFSSSIQKLAQNT